MTGLIQRFILSLLFLAAASVNTASDTNAGHPVFQLTINDAIEPATDDYIERAIAAASRQQAEMIVIQMDTPGGLDSANKGDASLYLSLKYILFC